MTIAISGPATVNTTVGLTSTSPNCTGTGGVACTFSFSLPACGVANCYHATIATYDAVSCFASCSIPTGAKELSGAQSVAFTIVGGTNNVARLTLGGIPASISVAPLVPGYLQGDAQRLRIWGPGAHKVLVLALDADGNAIVGAGAPVVSVSSSSSTLAVANPPTASPNIVTMSATTTGSPAVVTPGQVKLGVTVTPSSDSGGAPVSLSIPVVIAHSALYVGSSAGQINAYYDGNSGAPNYTIAGANTLIIGGAIYQLAGDANGSLYLAQATGSGEVLEFPMGAQGNVAPSATIAGTATTIRQAQGITVDPSGRIDVVSGTGASIDQFAAGTSGNVAPATTLSGPNTGFLAPVNVATDAAATLYVVDGGRVLEFASGASGNVAPANTLTVAAISGADSIAVDASGAISLGGNGPVIATYAPGASGGAAPIATISGSNTQLPATIYSLAVDAGGTLYAGGSANVVAFAAGANGNVAPISTITVGGAYALWAVPAP